MASSTKPKSKSKQSKSGEKTGRKKDRRLNAKNADKHDLYQRAVNSPDQDVDFLIETYREMRGKDATHMREDFCGTALLAAEWISRSDDYTAEGFDLDPDPIAWGKEHNFKRLGDAAKRMTWHESDVRAPADRRPDVTTAANFSYWLFLERRDLLEYFKSVHADLADDGLFIIDMYGGPDAMVEGEEERDLGGGIEYIWDQVDYSPATGRYDCAIHFRFRDGSEMHNAFEYTWRLWGLPELKDVMSDAGFSQVDTYFEGTDPDDEEEGDGVFVKDGKGENIDAWLSYLVAQK
jgi:hypothetical protein